MQHSLLSAIVIVSCVALAAPADAQCQTLNTNYNTNNGGSNGGAILFDVQVNNPAGVNIAKIGCNVNGGPVGNFVSMDVYTLSGTYVGNEQNQAAWTLTSSGTGNVSITNTPSIIDVTDFVLAPGAYGFCLVFTSATGHRYTSGATMFSNADMTITAGAAQNTPFTAVPFTPRSWNGTFYYNCSPLPTSYCTAGTSTSGCLATISANGNPSVSQAFACNIAVAGVEGQKSGIIFYGINQAGFSPTPWGTGGNSYLCVKAPSQRTGVQQSSGGAGLCNGALVLDWNAYQTANPNALGNPWSVGAKAYVQAWYRDPPAVKTTSLSNGIELTYQP